MGALANIEDPDEMAQCTILTLLYVALWNSPLVWKGLKNRLTETVFLKYQQHSYCDGSFEWISVRQSFLIPEAYLLRWFFW